jgi:hypothetical protein
MWRIAAQLADRPAIATATIPGWKTNTASRLKTVFTIADRNSGLKTIQM